MMIRQLLQPILILLLIMTSPLPVIADRPTDLPVVVYEPDCTGMRCSRPLRAALVNEITAALANGSLYKPVDRANLQKVMKEQFTCRKGIRKGIISRECRIRVGRIMQAQKMVQCRLVKLGRKDYQVTVDLTDLTTMKTVRSMVENCWGCKTRQLLSATGRAATRLGRSKGTSPAPAPMPRKQPAGPEKKDRPAKKTERAPVTPKKPVKKWTPASSAAYKRRRAPRSPRARWTSAALP